MVKLFKKIQDRMRYFDWWIAILVLGLMSFGSVMSFSASAGLLMGTPLSALSKQLVFYFIAFLMMLIGYHASQKWIKSLGLIAYLMYGLSLLLMVMTLFFPPINGARGWIIWGPISIQPVELYKVCLILWGSFAMTRQHANNYNFWHLGWIRFGIIFFLLLSFPDTGGLIITTGIIAIIIMASGVKKRFAIVSMGGVILIWQIGLRAIEPILSMSSHYSWRRFTAYLNPWKYAQTTGNQVINSYYAISNGGLFGRGLGRSLQKNSNLPEPNTDFIMAVVSEEMGAIGVGLVILALLIIVWRLIYFAFRTPSMRYRLLLVGSASYLLLQMIVNLGGVVGALPITGVTFPLISVGGSSILSLGMMFAIDLNVIKQIKIEKEAYLADKNKEQA
ncbi:FtsW/RodA/SpoVE family cell cycle protein [Weissella coleopterorum]|uniref:Probable peptidoglycan glycosyltransferase FtsW n=1 Tax=Weissella coleopterorum TaxID=2714949 RepID=A0A6G8B0C1_9LACO|nr:FtsW/RodA/SpoVE family cell cycle protein [Weissella coleopterorum]QIL50687.1 FtsW/RodA/SpoVE family cell cycle protein [Weissella coleopterorum]